MIQYVFKEHPMTVKRWIFIVILIAGLTACEGVPGRTDLSEGFAGQSQTWIDAPLPNSTIPKLPYKLMFHGANANGIAEFEILVDGVSTAKVLPSSTTMNGTLFFGEFMWTPVAPGTFLIEVKAIGNGQDSSSDQVYVTVMGDEEEEEEVTPVATATATPRSTTAPAATNTPVPEVGQIKIHLFVDANSNGNQDGSEVDYRNVQVSLRACSCGERCSESQNATTTDSGNAYFGNLPYGSYCVTTNSGFTPTTTYPVSLNVNSPALITKNIGYTN
jgi:hypothetical protein